MKILVIVLLCLGIPIATVLIVGLLLPIKHKVSRSARFSQRPQIVWGLITGPPDWRSNVQRFEVISDEAKSRKWKEFDKRGQAITFEVSDFVPERRLVTHIADKSLPFGGNWTYDLASEDSGSLLTITEDGEVYNPIFRFVSRFIFGQASQIDTYLRDLKTRLEKTDGTDSKLHN